MRLFRRKKNNRGFSLVETVCAVAILGLTSTAIGSAMVMSTENYQRGNTEVDVQKEAQLATNLIGNLLVDAVNAEYVGNVLTIYGEGVEYMIVYDSAAKKLTYKETKAGGTPVTGTLAENVSHFEPDLTNWTSKNARIDMSIEKNGKNYEASYNTTARNGASFNVGAAESAFIICESELVLEPGQTFDLPVTLYGNPEIPGFALESATPVGTNIGSSNLIKEENAVKIIVGADASDMFTFIIKTNAVDDNTPAQPLDTKTVTVKIRRATSISKNVTPLVSDYSAGTTYQIAATALADYPDKIIGKEYDDDYKDPRKVAFNVVSDGTVVEGTDYSVAELDGQVNVTLINALPQGSKITVNMVSEHAFGTHNKTGHAYDTSVKDSYVIENAQGAVWVDSGIMRGNDNMMINSTLKLDGDNSIKSDFGGEPRWYYRYRVKDSNDSTWKYYRTEDNSIAKKFNASETRLWLPEYAYEIDMICMSFSSSDGNYYMEYPQDSTLLAELQAQWPGINLLQGWVEADKNKPNAATSFLQYGGHLIVGKTEIFYDKAGTFVKQYGSHDDPYIITKDTGEVDIDWNTTNLTRGHYDYSYDIYMYNSVSGKYDIYISSSSLKDNIINIEFDNSKFKFNNFKTNNDGTTKSPGNYVFVPSVVGKYNDIDSSSSLMDGYKMADQGQGTWALSDKDTGYGCFYFKIQ